MQIQDHPVIRNLELTGYPDGEHMYFLNRACVELGQRVKEGEPIGEYKNV